MTVIAEVTDAVNILGEGQIETSEVDVATRKEVKDKAESFGVITSVGYKEQLSSELDLLTTKTTVVEVDVEVAVVVVVVDDTEVDDKEVVLPAAVGGGAGQGAGTSQAVVKQVP